MAAANNTSEKVDCVVVGAGWYGLGAAKQFHVTQPKASLVVFETESSVGGTWGDSRLYPGLKTNNLWGTYEFPDFPMTTERFGVKEKEHIPGTVVNTYMKAYASEFGIDKLLRFNSKVTVAEHHDEGGWTLTVEKKDQDGEDTYKLFTRRLVVATGLTSDPFMPHYKGQEEFGGPIFHTKQFKDHADTVKTAKSVTILGAGKSGYDAAYAYATAGATVNWVIRSTGHGPTWIAPSFVTPLKKWIEKLANVRALSWFSPCIFADADGYGAMRSFYHNTMAGRFLTNQFWNVLGNDVLTLNNYDGHPETAKLKPWIPAMFTATSFSILNYDQDFYELVRTSGKIHIHISEIDHLSAGQVHLTNGTSFASDAVLSSSGWKIVPPMKFLPEGIESEIGLPHPIIPADSSTPIPEADLGNNHALLAKADKEILARFPRLKDQPVWNKNFVGISSTKGVSSSDPARPDAPLTPYTLYHFIVPASERFLRTRDIAFAGMVSNFSNIITSHLQGLWISAYFQNKLAINPCTAVDNGARMEDLQYETVLHNRFGKWRYPIDWGNRHPSFIFDAVPYLDLLCRDLGITVHRKGGKGMLAEIYDPYGPEDYRDVVDEWTGKFGEEK
ncbi:hypothetical protein QBC37DRAFT_418222 [Rhypophila decipiens]|uniref:Flavin-containing monooxygenase n=1 Tax=Rhypophila decipiens TaxID=261697 RepID=A0AAN6YB57_9PEZI|nr:hypothetical protein QBC37DRAFT_418222 [Rhypophila decipiens]